MLWRVKVFINAPHIFWVSGQVCLQNYCAKVSSRQQTLACVSVSRCTFFGATGTTTLLPHSELHGLRVVWSKSIDVLRSFSGSPQLGLRLHRTEIFCRPLTIPKSCLNVDIITECEPLLCLQVVGVDASQDTRYGRSLRGLRLSGRVSS